MVNVSGILKPRSLAKSSLVFNWFNLFIILSLVKAHENSYANDSIEIFPKTSIDESWELFSKNLTATIVRYYWSELNTLVTFFVNTCEHISQKI